MPLIFRVLLIDLDFIDLDAIMSEIPTCPQCAMENTYSDGGNYVCKPCAHRFRFNR